MEEGRVEEYFKAQSLFSPIKKRNKENIRILILFEIIIHITFGRIQVTVR